MPITRAYAQAAEPGNFFVAGKNKVINGDFNVNQRVFTSTTSDAAYTFDRWRTSREGGTVTYSSEAFTLGSAPVSGYESKNYARIVTASQSAASHYAQFIQRIENVRTFAGQTVTLSFWAKASSGTPSIAAESHQSFGSGGSPSSAVFTTFGKTAITTSWARYSLTLAIPSISGKTLGTADDSFLGINFWTSAGSDYNARSSSLGLQNVTIDLWGVQVEAGSVATPFTTATGTLAGELAACQRYYIRYGGNVVDEFFGWGHGNGSTQVYCRNPLPVTMRTTPTFGSAAIANFTLQNGSSTTTALTSVAISGAANKNFAAFNFTKTGATFTGGQMFGSYADNTLNAYLEWSAEL